jgi:hypothetical protein
MQNIDAPVHISQLLHRIKFLLSSLSSHRHARLQTLLIIVHSIPVGYCHYTCENKPTERLQLSASFQDRPCRIGSQSMLLVIEVNVSSISQC